MDATEPSFAAGEACSRAAAQRESLSPGTRLGDFEIVRTLGTGGFGTVYLARDRQLERDVAVKEYLPAQLAYRAEGLRVEVRTPAVAAAYAAGLRSFVNEARILARFNHPAVVEVHRFWEANGTAYMVMPWVQGPTLREVRRAMKSPPTEGWLRAMIDPLLDALAMLHAQGIYHRDIAPDNILLPAPHEPVLLDFGAARRVIGDRTQTITAVLKPSFAPIEQYAEASQLRQGPWTDLYALGAVVIYMMTAVPPPPSTVRAVQDELPLATDPPPAGVSASFLAAIHWALAVRPQDRPQSVQELRNALDGLIAPPARATGDSAGLRLSAPLPVRAAPTRAADPVVHDSSPGAPDRPSASAEPVPVSLATLASLAAFAPPLDALPVPGPAREPVTSDTAPPWDPTIRLASTPPLPVLPALPRIRPPRRAPRALLAAGTCVAALAGGVAFTLLGGPVDPEASTWRALGRHAAEWSQAQAVEETIEEAARPAAAAALVAAPAAPPPAPVLRTVAATLDAGGRADLQASEHGIVPLARAAVSSTQGLGKPAAQRGGGDARKPAGARSVRAVKASHIGPREACGERSLFGMAICVNRQCESARFLRHPQCVELRRHWEERRMRGEHP